jgi:hypothetical protein
MTERDKSGSGRRPYAPSVISLSSANSRTNPDSVTYIQTAIGARNAVYGTFVLLVQNLRGQRK